MLVTFAGSRLALREAIKIRGNRELATTLADAERRDPDWTWERLNAGRKKPPEGRNSAPLVPRIKSLMAVEWGTRFAKSEWTPKLEGPPNRRYSPRVIDQARRELAASAEAVALARTLKSCPFGHREIVLMPNVPETPLPHLEETQKVADLLRWDVVLAIEDGDPPRATDDLLAMLNVSRSIGDEPFSISQLTRMGCRTRTVQSAERLLAQTPDAPELAALQRALAADAEEPVLYMALRGERAACDRLFENLQAGTTSLAQINETNLTGTGKRFVDWLYREYLPGDRAFALQRMNEFVEAARHPIHEQRLRVMTVPAPIKDFPHNLSMLLTSGLDKMAHAYWRSTAIARCAVAGIACERFRQQHAHWPDSLDDLVGSFLDTVPLDPFGGKHLQYVKIDSGVVVYSVGKEPVNPLRVTPLPPTGLPEGIEFGFRLWNPDSRRLPAPPEPEGELLP